MVAGRKCDFRLYCLLTEHNCYLYKANGIVRISPNVYDVDDKRIETHITNTSVSKNYVFQSRMSVKQFLAQKGT